MKDTDTQYRRIVIAALFLVVVIFLVFRKCACGKGETKTVKIDTVYKEIKGEVFYIPKVDTVFFTRTTTKLVPYLTLDTLYIPELKDVDTIAILSDYYKARIYRDTLKNQYGYISLTDTISQNKIKGRGVKTSLLIPEITRTITLSQPKRNQIYIGAGLFGNEDDYLDGYNVNLALKTRRDKMIEVGYNQLFNGAHYYSLGMKFKISFRKN